MMGPGSPRDKSSQCAIIRVIVGVSCIVAYGLVMATGEAENCGEY